MKQHATRAFDDGKSWGLILGGSSGFGLATAERMAREGMNLILAHKDSPTAIRGPLGQQFERLQSHGIKLITFNGNLLEEDDRIDLMELVTEHVPTKSLRLVLHSVAAGACKPLVEPQWQSCRTEAMVALCKRLAAQGCDVTPDQMTRAIDQAFHDDGCDALYTLATSSQPADTQVLSEDDYADTVAIMGYDLAFWARELAERGLTANPSRIIGLTSEGNQRSWSGYAAVSAAKAALEATARSLAVELGPRGLLTCILQAGVTDTPAGNAIPHFDLIKAQSRLRNPLGRLTRVEDVADVIFGLTQPHFNFVNGSMIHVDGGEAFSAG